MTGPSPHGSRPTAWYARPTTVLPIIAGIVIAVALLAPEQIAGRTGDARLTTYSTEPQGARMFYELTQRLGWRVEQRRAADATPDSNAIFAVLAPAVPLRMQEVHALLERVRQGGALLTVLNEGADLLADSLHITTGPDGIFHVQSDMVRGCPTSREIIVPLWPDNEVHLLSLRWKAPLPPGSMAFMPLVMPTVNGHAPRERSAVDGFSYGRGRVVVISDPDVLRNDALRTCTFGLDVSAIGMLTYLRDGGETPRRHLVFDEFHQGYGPQPGTAHAIGGYVFGTASGRTILALFAAGLLLLAAKGPRMIAPRDPERIERRSPLEHVDALARAYAQVGATRTATARLLRGIRRRVDRGTRRTGLGASDDAFLERAQQTVPAVTPQITRIRQALDATVSRREFAEVGTALQELESSLTRI